MSNITLSAAVRSNLLSLQNTASLLDTTQTRLSTGNKVNSALDNPTSYFTAASLNSRASDLGNLLDSVGNAVQTIQAANDGITSITKLVESAQSTANQAQQTSATVDSAEHISSITGSTYTAPGGSGSTLTINGTAVTIGASDTLSTVVASINTAAITGVTAAAGTGTSAGKIVLTGAAGTTVLIGGTGTAGFTTGQTDAYAAAGATQVANPARAALVTQYNGLLTQIDQLTKDAGYNGNNLLAGTSSTLNALWARALEDVADIAQWLGNHGTAAWALDRYAGVRQAFDAFYDPERGVYVDHLVDGVQRPEAAQHGGAAALAAGLVPTDRIDRVVARLTDRSRLVRHSWVMDSVTVDGGSTGFVHLVTGYPEPTWDVQHQMVEAEPFFRYVLHDGLARGGRADLITDLCRDWQVFLDSGETTWPECWVGGTRCHGWSSTPTRDLIVHTLGISPAEPGYAAVRVQPALGGLEWARATVPTPHGPITVEARADGTLEVDSPVPVITGD